MQTASSTGQSLAPALGFRALEFPQQFRCFAERNGNIIELARDGRRKVGRLPWDNFIN
jgi:hypothetical protein